MRFECPVCYADFRRDGATPMVLPCGHSVCRPCLRRLPAPRRCPLCRQALCVPREAVPRNLGLIDALRMLAVGPGHGAGDRRYEQFQWTMQALQRRRFGGRR